MIDPMNVSYLRCQACSYFGSATTRPACCPVCGAASIVIVTAAQPRKRRRYMVPLPGEERLADLISQSRSTAPFNRPGSQCR